MKPSRIGFYANGEKVQEYPYVVIFRKDVAEVLHNPAAESSGFAFVASIQTPKPLEVFFEYDTEVGTGQLHLGSIPADTDRKEGSFSFFRLAIPEVWEISGFSVCSTVFKR